VVALASKDIMAWQGECLSPQFSQKTNENIQLYYFDTSGRIVFIHFLGELRRLLIAFEIHLPSKKKDTSKIFLPHCGWLS
jgi:hypothetical protein